MVWCGFDEKMRSGIIDYAEGIARAIRKKALEAGVGDARQMDRERVELCSLDEIITERLADRNASNDAALRLKAFGGMVAIARYLIEDGNASHALKAGFHDDAYDLGGLIEEFDRYFDGLPKTLDHATNARTTLAHVIPTNWSRDEASGSMAIEGRM